MHRPRKGAGESTSIYAPKSPTRSTGYAQRIPTTAHMGFASLSRELEVIKDAFSAWDALAGLDYEAALKARKALGAKELWPFLLSDRLTINRIEELRGKLARGEASTADIISLLTWILEESCLMHTQARVLTKLVIDPEVSNLLESAAEMMGWIASSILDAFRNCIGYASNAPSFARCVALQIEKVREPVEAKARFITEEIERNKERIISELEKLYRRIYATG